MIWLLIKLRYKLNWAQARVSRSKIAIFAAFYVIGLIVFLLATAGGMGAAISGLWMGQDESVARRLLGGLFINGLILGIIFGAGPRVAFADSVLRRYPLTPAMLFFVRHLIGLLDPVWLIMLAAASGLSLGFAAMGKTPVFVGVAAAVFFVIVNYLTVIALLSLGGRLLQYRWGATAVGVIVFTIFTLLSAAAPVMLDPARRGGWFSFDRMLSGTAPGITASLLTAPGFGEKVFYGALMLVWGGGLLLALVLLERLPAVSRSSAVAKARWAGPVSRLAGLFGQRYAPLVEKALRYHLRCNRVRFNLVTPAPMVVLLPYLIAGGRGPSEVVFSALVLLFFSGAVSTHGIMFNQFGYDGAGIKRLGVFPIPFAVALRAGSLVSVILGSASALAAVISWELFVSPSFHWREFWILLCDGAAGVLCFNALGLWTSVLAPKRSDFQSYLGNNLTGAANVVMAGGLLGSFAAALALTRSWNGWTALLLVAGCAGLYGASFLMIAPILDARYERLVEAIASDKAG